MGLASDAILWETPSSGGPISAGRQRCSVFLAHGDGTELRTLYDKTPGGLIPVDKASEAILRDYELSSNMHGGMAVVEGWVMFGTGNFNVSGFWTGQREKLIGRKI